MKRMVRVSLDSCPKCKQKMNYRVRRNSLERLIPFSKKLRCFKCNKSYLKIM